MTVEAEIKARLINPDAVRQRLDRYATGTVEVYRDTYLDTAGGDLDRTDRELRVRTIERDATARHLLTYKEPAVDPVTRSKPEHETSVADPAATLGILAGLGYLPVLSFTKDCRNYRFAHGGRTLLAILVTVPELADTYLEVETAAAKRRRLPWSASLTCGGRCEDDGWHGEHDRLGEILFVAAAMSPRAVSRAQRGR
jgi:adenylate cyclase class 2